MEAQKYQIEIENPIINAEEEKCVWQLEPMSGRKAKITLDFEGNLSFFKVKR